MAAHSGELRGIGRQGVVQNVAVHGASHNCIQGRINFAVGLALGIRHDGGGSRINGQCARGRRDRVVRVGAGRHCDRMAAHSRELGRIGRQGVVQDVAVHGASHNRIQGRINFPVVFALRVRDDGGRSSINGQQGIRRSDGVVRVGARRHCDRMAAHSGELRGIGRQCVVQNVAIHSAGHHSIQRGINLAVALALGVRHDRCGLRTDGQGGLGGSDCVIRVGTRRHGNRV